MKGDVRFKVGDEKLFHVLHKKICSIEADLIYASENLALCLSREEQQKSCISTFRKAYLYQDNFPRRQLL
jgi:hypothetical protein